MANVTSNLGSNVNSQTESEDFEVNLRGIYTLPYTEKARLAVNQLAIEFVQYKDIKCC